jgi:hypothetical protein
MKSKKGVSNGSAFLAGDCVATHNDDIIYFIRNPYPKSSADEEGVGEGD